MTRFPAGDDPIPATVPIKITHARARPPAPALGAGALGPGGLGPEGLGPLGALGLLGDWARARAAMIPRQPCCAAQRGLTRGQPLLACYLTRGGAAFGPWPPALLPAPRAGEATRYTLGQGQRQRQRCRQWEKSAARICAAAGPSRKIGSADLLTNTGWTLGWPGQAGKFV